MKWSLNLLCLLAGLVLGFTALLPAAHAELIGVAQLVTPAETYRDDAPATATVTRPDGVDPMQARVAAMSSEDVRASALRPAPSSAGVDAWSDSEMAMPVLRATVLLALALLLVAFDGAPRQTDCARDAGDIARMPRLAQSAGNRIFKEAAACFRADQDAV